MKHLALGPITALIVLLTTQLANMPLPAALTLSTVVWVAWWWVTECIPLPVTSLLPFVLLPTFGVIDTQTAAAALGDNIILLFMAAFMLAKAVEASGVHKRMALSLVSRIGANDGRKVVISFMAATAFLSMWISNTAGVLALLPVALALADASEDKNFQQSLLLGLAYAGSLGGIATLVGTPPNLIFASIYQNMTGSEFSFTRWLGIGLPMVIIGLPVTALWLTRNVRLSKPLQLPTATAMTTYEKRVLTVFGSVVLLWITRTTPFNGWTGLLGIGSLNDATVALAGVIAMFVIPSGKATNEKLLNWSLAKDIPWGILLLFAGGICLARGVMESGLGELIGQSLTALDILPLWLLIFVLTLTVSFVTEFTSNTATATLLMPILAATATALDLPAELLMIPAVIACSCAFCMPVATPPNSIVFASKRITIKTMAREGMVLNILLAVVTTLVVLLFV
ncbi:SLC13 family permease [Idiomarina sp. HP20-50]|uniref:SLC13 family permease n=1 Tax=Idiomarina sp. HP20-50 TaxID=3070813 RepID=UPI00294B889F|nr:SLC13 family permease [Idiomarina sp. HP20-50]MDV6316713.1 SLC13 family permease [Idiomarina sp. HP20-50]